MTKYGIFLLVGALYLHCVTALSRCACTREFNPVCGSNGVTYSNHCLFKCAKAQRPEMSFMPGRCRKRGKRQTEVNNITCACTRDYRPVCGTDGATYANECNLNCAKSKNSNLQLRSLGPCQNDVDQQAPACFCTFIYKPVCGTDGVTYGNDCELNCARSRNLALEVKNQGECQKETSPKPNRKPPCVCPYNYSPVCGSDGETYPNKCILNCARVFNTNLKVKHQGVCEQSFRCTCYRNYEPICGSDGRTYGNECTFNCERKRKPDLEIKHEGECQEGDQRIERSAPLAECACNYVYSPVCGDDGKTYSNECQMRCHAKESNSDIKMSHTGRC